MAAINIIFLALMIILICSIVNNIIEIISSATDNAVSKSRLKQFKKGTNRESASSKESIDSYTESIRTNLFPKIQKFLPSLKIENLEQLDRDLKFIGWDDTFTAETFIASCIALKIGGAVLVLVGLLLKPVLGLLYAGIICLIGIVAFGYLDKQVASEKQTINEKLFASFPEFIRIVSGYLTANMPLVMAIEESIKYVSDEWKPILGQFIVDCNTKGVTIALEGMRDTVDIFEVREFVALVRLTLEQGGEAKESFNAQADKVAEMQKDLFLLKVSKRKMYATICQGPSTMLTMVVLMVPTLMSAMTALNGA